MADTATSIQLQERRETVPRGLKKSSKKAQEEQEVKTKMESSGLLERIGLMVSPEGRSPS